MKRMLKIVLVAIPALVVAATVGMSTMGCGDDTGGLQMDMATPVVHDLATPPVHDMAMKKGD
jgi:hypothetical protein